MSRERRRRRYFNHLRTGAPVNADPTDPADPIEISAANLPSVTVSVDAAGRLSASGNVADPRQTARMLLAGAAGVLEHLTAAPQAPLWLLEAHLDAVRAVTRLEHLAAQADAARQQQTQVVLANGHVPPPRHQRG